MPCFFKSACSSPDYPAGNLRLSVEHLNQMVNVEIYGDVRPSCPRIDGGPDDMGHAMMLIDRKQADIAYLHFLRSDRAVMSMALRHASPELIVVLPGSHSGEKIAPSNSGIKQLVEKDARREGAGRRRIPQTPYD